MENPIKMDDLGVPLFLETPISKFNTFRQLRNDDQNPPVGSEMSDSRKHRKTSDANLEQ